jgi:hypothetical protein
MVKLLLGRGGVISAAEHSRLADSARELFDLANQRWAEVKRMESEV